MSDKKLAILDDFFPNLTTGFRIAEFNYYFDKFPNCEAYVHRYDNHYPEYAATYPQFQDRVKSFDMFDWTGKSYDLYYTVFLSNANHFNFAYELNNTPFVFELYPGGGFWFDDEKIDDCLKKVLNSPLFRKVIVTQRLTYDYIVNRGFVTPDKVAYIYGMVTHPEYFHPTIQKQFYKKDKYTFDICFVAHKYMSKGTDKGFPIFIETYKKLSKAADNIRFHVVGNFEPDEIEIDTSELGNRIIFYGQKDKRFLDVFYSKMDIIVSPNKPFILIPGKSFDGFPTGCCIDAGLHGVGVFCTDLLNMNEHFEQEKEIYIIEPHADEIAESILEYYHNPDELYRMSVRGQKKFKEVFDFNTQMKARASVIEQFL